MTDYLAEMTDRLQDCTGIGDEALELVFGILGWSEETIEKILYYETGYRDLAEYERDFIELNS